MNGWLVLGAGGMLGRDLVTALQGRGTDPAALAHSELDVTDCDAVHSAVQARRPEIIVNCAAWTAVDDAEAHEDSAREVNGRGAENVAAACAEYGARLVQVSTDYVFGGDSGRPHAEYDLPSPRTAYGRSKLAGEQAVLRLLPATSYVVRTAWLYGAHGPNFVRTMIEAEGRRRTVDVVADQHGQPTWAADVADQIIALASGHAPPGIYHATSSGETTWFGLAMEVFQLLGADPARVRAVASDRHPRAAARPSYSVLGHDRHVTAGIEPIADWRMALRRAFPALLPAGEARQPG